VGNAKETSGTNILATLPYLDEMQHEIWSMIASGDELLQHLADQLSTVKSHAGIIASLKSMVSESHEAPEHSPAVESITLPDLRLEDSKAILAQLGHNVRVQGSILMHGRDHVVAAAGIMLETNTELIQQLQGELSSALDHVNSEDLRVTGQALPSTLFF